MEAVTAAPPGAGKTNAAVRWTIAAAAAVAGSPASGFGAACRDS